MPPKSRQPVVVAATCVVAVVLTALAATVVWSSVAARTAQTQIEEVTAVVLRYRDLQNAVAGQAYAEAGHRRAPSPATRAAIDAATADVERAVQHVRAVGDATDRSTMSYLLVLNRRYVAEVARTIDAGVPPGTDDRVAGPALHAVRDLLAAAVSRHDESRDRVVARQHGVLSRLTWLLVLVLVAGSATIGGCWAALTRAHRRLGLSAEDSERRAGHDPLTGLANRSVLDTRLKAAMSAPDADCAVLLVDLDHFKPVNDTFGHAAGDDVLVAVAGALRTAVRSSDLVARIGGDEFAVVLVPGRSAAVVADKLLLAVAAVSTPGGGVMSASVGVAVAGVHGSSPAQLLAAADAALYRAKQDGRGRTATSATSATSASPSGSPAGPQDVCR